MEKRIKMSKSDRAKQFAPFDSLKGLQEALRMKEYEHDRMQKGDISQEKLNELTKILLEYKKNDIVKLSFYVDGYIQEKIGKIKVDFVSRIIIFNNIKISFDDIVDISIEQ